MNNNDIYLCIDLKSFYASVECSLRNLDSMTTNLVVADDSRGKGSICLAVSPSLRKLGVKNRCRLYEIPDNLEYIIAKPRMKLYIEYSANIYAIYLKYISKEDIWVYSIDECFLYITPYLSLYNLKKEELAKMLMDDIYKETKIRATAGIGTNMFLAKLAMDIIAKKSSSYIGYLDEKKFKEEIWHHEPITDIWNIGEGIANRLKKYNCFNLFDVTKLDEKILYSEFHENAKYLIDHANGIETCSIKDCHEYIKKSKSLSSSQVLLKDYSSVDALLILKEMIELLVLELIDKKYVTNSVKLNVSYSKDVVKPLSKSKRVGYYTNSYEDLKKIFLDLYKENIDKNYAVRKIGISLNNLIDEKYKDQNLFSDDLLDEKEKAILTTINSIKKKHGKNSILKAMNLEEKATTRKRNNQIGGHNSE